MPWVLVAISAYFLLAIVQTIDKYLLTGPIPGPRVYAFFIGALGILFLVFIPLVGFEIPSFGQIILAISAGIIFIWALIWFFKALFLFEASRVIPAIGGLVPVFTFLLVYIISGGKEILPGSKILAFCLLILGTFIITIKKEKLVTAKSLAFSSIAAFLSALAFVLTKYVYMAQPFWSGFIWTRIGGFLAAIFLLLFAKEIKEEIFKKRISLKRKTPVIFFSNQAMGAGANILQNWAVALAPLAYVAVVRALEGIKHVFIFIFAIFLSLVLPRILKEEISRKILFQKLFAILLIGIGLAILAL